MALFIDSNMFQERLIKVVPREGTCGCSRGQREAEQVAGVGDEERKARG